MAEFRPQYKLDLILPRRIFSLGETIPFEVKLENPNFISISSMSASLIQHCYYTEPKRNKNFFSSRNRDQKIKFKQTFKENFITESDDILSTFGALIGTIKIPTMIPPTVKPNWKLEHVNEIQYFLKVYANRSESEYGTEISEAFPIEIGVSRIVKATDNLGFHSTPESLGGSEVLRGSRSYPQGSPTSLMESRRSSIVSNFELAGGFLGVGGKDGPPRYSMLSLPIVSSRSNSVETLPPHYEDTLMKKY